MATKDPSSPLLERTYWTLAQATLIRAAAMMHLAIMVCLFFIPARLLTPWGIPIPPATFLHAFAVAYGVLGFGLARALVTPREQGRLLVECAGLVKVGWFGVVLFEVATKHVPVQAALLMTVDLAFGAAMVRISRGKERARGSS